MADSDNDSGGAHNGGNGVKLLPREQDRFLPIANVSRIMKKALPANVKISKYAKETVQECVSTFINFITGNASNKLPLAFSGNGRREDRGFLSGNSHTLPYQGSKCGVTFPDMTMFLSEAFLDGNLLRSFKSVPVSNNQFGASRPEEAARWIQSFHEASLRGAPDGGDDVVGCSKRRWQSFSISHPNFVDWTLSSADVIAPSPWTIFGCQNGLQLFKEAKDRDSNGKKWDDHPAIMAVGVVDETSEAIFQTLMSLGPSR
ncbi:hypothetical protein JHK85_016930 [Glycine max]|nr:hypothetical protein JHK85_016930 [Glycine max]